MASSDSQIDKPQRGCPKRAELPDVNTALILRALLYRTIHKFYVSSYILQLYWDQRSYSKLCNMNVWNNANFARFNYAWKRKCCSIDKQNIWVFYQANITPICVNLGDTIPANFVLLQRKVITSRTLKFICKEDHSTYFRCEIFQGFCTNSGFFQGCYLVHCLFLFNLSQLLLSSLYFPCLSFLFKALLFSFKVFLALNLEQLFLTPFLLQW